MTELPIIDDKEIQIIYIPEIEGHNLLFKRINQSVDLRHDILNELARNFQRMSRTTSHRLVA